MTIMEPVSENDPMMKAWKEYSSTREYRNSWRHAENENHRDGSMWAAFVSGYSAATLAARPPADGQGCTLVDVAHKALSYFKARNLGAPAKAIADELQEVLYTQSAMGGMTDEEMHSAFLGMLCDYFNEGNPPKDEFLSGVATALMQFGKRIKASVASTSAPAPQAEAVVRAAKELRAECEDHRARYTGRAEGKLSEYWRGRRDEAGWARDKLDAALEAGRK